MRAKQARMFFVVFTLCSLSFFIGCAGMKFAPRGGVLYYPQELPESGQAVEEARTANKDKQCPDAFKSAEDLKNKAYEIYLQCRTQEAIDMAKDAANKAKALCPAPKPEPKPEPKIEPKIEPKPEAKPLDTDGDGVYDDKDRCPNTPKGVPVDSNGCPKDSDSDGVYDYEDKCPDTPKNIAVDNTGCPIPLKEKVSIDLLVEFDTNSAKIRSIYNEHLEKVSNFLKAYPDAMAVIEGHTDSVSSEQYNLKLSQKRAESVMKYLIDNFKIDPARLKAVGYGESMPVADNKIKEGRQKNRRVVAVIETVVTKFKTK